MRSLVLVAALVFVFAARAGRADPAAEPVPPSAPQVPARPVDARSALATSPCRADKKPPFVFALGGSTMQIVLGPMLEKRLGKEGFRVASLGKSASGLARYDYFDWPTTVRGLLAQHDPDVFIVAIGSNDGQSLRDADGRWYPLDRPAWREEYARRVDAFLELLAGPGRRRAVIWFGPAAHADDKKRARGAVVSEVIRDRIQRFAGRAFYIDLYARTATADGGALNELRVPGSDEVQPLRKPDGFHLTRPGVEAMMYTPARALLDACRTGR